MYGANHNFCLRSLPAGKPLHHTLADIQIDSIFTFAKEVMLNPCSFVGWVICQQDYTKKQSNEFVMI